MAEDYDYNPGHWQGHDFRSARAHYDRHVGRSYTKAKAKGTTASDMVPASVRTESTSPVVIMVDVTGSMGKWPATMFSKLPYLELEGQEYLGPDMEISWAAIGDAVKGDRYPLQVRDFTKGTDLKVKLEELIIEGGGGGGGEESYELGALYYATNCEMPFGVKPLFILVADEMPYDHVPASRALHVAKARLDEDQNQSRRAGRRSNDLSTEEVFEMLKQKFEVYLVHKPYGDGGQTRRRWVQLLGEDHIADLQDATRVVDVIFGIFARETNRVDYFQTEIEDRQEVHTPDGKRKVGTVYKALQTIHRPTAADAALVKQRGHSTLHRPTRGKKSKGLL